jgi:HSP20 family molecular chaperone IbpA
MALVPRFMDGFSDPAFNQLAPSMRDNFGLGVSPQDFFGPQTMLPRAFQQSLLPTGYNRAWDLLPSAQALLKDTKTVANVSVAKDGAFQVCVDVHHFAPKEITVRTDDDTIIIEGKHEERPDEHGYIERHFVRKYTLPKDYETTDIHSTLSSDGILTVKAPPPPKTGKRFKSIAIHRTGPVHLSIQDHPKETAGSAKKEKK